MTDTTATAPAVDEFIAAPTDVLVANASIDLVKAEKVYTLACTPGGVTNGRVYTDRSAAKAAVSDLRKHVGSRLNDGHVAKVEWYPVEGGQSFRVRVVPKSNRGRKPAAS